MALTYFKRFRMELDLRRWAGQPLPAPPGYRLWPWDAALLGAHADVKYRCFQHELDANIFPCFGSRDGCQEPEGAVGRDLAGSRRLAERRCRRGKHKGLVCHALTRERDEISI